jgi:hypothetical protein
MKIRFQADADLNQRIVRAVRRRQPAIDFQTADEAKIRSLSDPEVLAAAAAEGRMVVTHDRTTMSAHFANFIATQSSSGVFVLSQYLSLSLAVEELIMVWEASEADEWTNTIQFLPL